MLYEKGNEVVSLKFKAAGTSKVDWFSQANLISSPWNDLTTAANLLIFDITGEANRYFEITKSYGGCGSDAGWLVITGAGCSWETRIAIPSIQYSKLGNAVVWENFGRCRVSFLEFSTNARNLSPHELIINKVFHYHSRFRMG